MNGTKRENGLFRATWQVSEPGLKPRSVGVSSKGEVALSGAPHTEGGAGVLSRGPRDVVSFVG